MGDDFFKKMAIDTFAQIIISSNLKTLEFYINNSINLIRLASAQRYISTIRGALYIPFIGNYLKKELKLEPNDILFFIKEKNRGVFDLLSTERGRKWFYKQFNDWMGLVR